MANLFGGMTINDINALTGDCKELFTKDISENADEICRVNRELAAKYGKNFFVFWKLFEAVGPEGDQNKACLDLLIDKKNYINRTDVSDYNDYKEGDIHYAVTNFIRSMKSYYKKGFKKHTILDDAREAAAAAEDAAAAAAASVPPIAAPSAAPSAAAASSAAAPYPIASGGSYMSYISKNYIIREKEFYNAIPNIGDRIWVLKDNRASLLRMSLRDYYNSDDTFGSSKIDSELDIPNYTQWTLNCKRKGESSFSAPVRTSTPSMSKVVTRETNGNLLGPDGKSMNWNDHMKGTYCHGTFIGTNGTKDCVELIAKCVDNSSGLQVCLNHLKSIAGNFNPDDMLKSLKESNASNIYNIVKKFGILKGTVINGGSRKHYQLEEISSYLNNFDERMKGLGRRGDKTATGIKRVGIPEAIEKILSYYRSYLNANYELLFSGDELDSIKKSNPLFMSARGMSVGNMIVPSTNGMSYSVPRDLGEFALNTEWMLNNRKGAMGVMAIMPSPVGPMHRMGLMGPIGFGGSGQFGGSHLLPGLPMGMSATVPSTYQYHKMLRADCVKGLEGLYESVVKHAQASGKADGNKDKINKVKESIQEIYQKYKSAHQELIDLHSELNVANIFSSNVDDPIMRQLKDRARRIGMQVEDVATQETNTLDQIRELLNGIIQKTGKPINSSQLSQLGIH